MAGKDEFLFDDRGLVQEQRYRINKAVSDESTRRQSYYPGGETGPNAPPPKEAQNQSAASRAAAAAAADSRRIEVRQPTKYEQARLDTVKDRQQQNIVKKQVVCGREYQGNGFNPDPTQVNFIDFEVGEVYKKKVLLTNVSQSFNAFKVQQMPKEVRDLFEVVYTPQSMMSAGMSSHITVIFSPKEDLDIDTVVPILTQTGPFEIPVKCRRRRVVASVSHREIDMGQVVVAEEVSETLLIRNDGALPTKMHINGEFLQLLNVTQKNAKNQVTHTWNTYPELRTDKPNTMALPAFSTVSLTISFTPHEVSAFDTAIMIAFDDPEVNDEVVFVKAEAIDVPVFVDYNRNMNLHCCYYGTLYRDKVTVKNTTRSAARVQPTIPPLLKDCIEFVPKFGFAQPDGGTLDFQVKLTPQETIGPEMDIPVKIVVTDQVMPIFFRIKASLSRRDLVVEPPSLLYGTSVVQEALSQELSVTNGSRLPRTLGFTKVPPNIIVKPMSVVELAPGEKFTFTVAVQPTHVGTYRQTLFLRSELDEQIQIPVTGTGKVSAAGLQPSQVKLPPVCIGNSCSATTLLTNNTGSLQRFAFKLGAHTGVTVSPEMGQLEKGQSVPVVVTFTPTRHIVAPVVPPEVDESLPPELDEAAIAAAAAAAGKGAPKKSKKQEEEARAERERLVAEHWEQVAKQKTERARIVKEIDEMVPWDESCEPGEAWSRHRELLLPCFIEDWSNKAIFLSVGCTVVDPVIVPSIGRKNAQSEGVSGGTSPTRSPRSPSRVSPSNSRPGSSSRRSVSSAQRRQSRAKSSAAQKTKDAAAAAAAAAATAASLKSEIIPDAVLEKPGSAGLDVDFGDVPAQHTTRRTIVLKNTSNAPTQLNVQPLDPFGVFSVTRPPTTPLPVGHETEIVIQFAPMAKAVYVDTVTVKSSVGNDVTITCLGEGLPATLAIATTKDGLAAASGSAELSIDNGHALAGDKTEVPLFFQNLSPFALSIQTRFNKEELTNFNPNGTIPFSIHPHVFTIPANGTVEAQALFMPQSEAEFDATATIEYGGEGSTKLLRFRGFGWSKGLYVQFPEVSNDIASNFHSRAGIAPGLEQTRRVDVFSAFGDATDAHGSALNPIVIPFNALEGETATQIITVGNNKGSANGDFTVEGFVDADAKNGWKVDPVKSNVAPGARVELKCTFTPTAMLLDSLPLQNVGAVSLSNIRVVLKGGSPANDRVYYVTLKGTARRV